MWVTTFIVIMQMGESLLQLCKWYFLQCIMCITVSVVIMQVTISVTAMWVAVSSNNFIFLSLEFLELELENIYSDNNNNYKWI